MATTKELMLQAQQLIRDRNYAEARRLLLTINHPKAKEWLERIDQIEPQPVQTTLTQPDSGSSDWLQTMSRNEGITATAPFPQKPLEPKRPQPAIRSSSPVIVEEKTKLPFLGAIGLILVTAIGGFLIGGGLYLSSLEFYAIIASVAIAGGLGGGLMWLVIKATKVRDTFIVGILAFVFSLLAYGTYRYLEYDGFRSDFRQAIYEEEPNADPVLVEEYIDEILVEETGQPGLLGFLIIQAQEGLSMTFSSRYSSRDSGVPLTLSPALTVIYWFFEILIMTVAAAFIADNAAAHPFCDDTNHWLKFEKLKGRVPRESIEAFGNALSREDYAAAAGLLEKRRFISQPFLVVEVGRCHEKSADALLKITRQQGRSSKVIVNDPIPADAYKALVSTQA